MSEGCTDDFHCTNQGQSRVIDGVDDAKEMCITRKAFSLLGDRRIHTTKLQRCYLPINFKMTDLCIFMYLFIV